ncbi:hypothetical protein E8E13_008796 [Curvularia kusanoi]|uniref:LicD/FKTN/FKRP nucleotidyltransferase domain-containing protein n=1 Tax=Curvularia kusanoi TaxID=90978 RepID=A0A9P4WB62_CURKU|nr:hypothetical protein E8E13_008796 [Curvularia kusanoi]
MYLPLELLSLILLLLPTSSYSAPLSPRAASFPSLKGLTTLSQDHTRPSHYASKYFTESTFHPHYDGRFASALLPAPVRRFQLQLLVRSYAIAMRRAGVRTWVMHGSLLGWWWGGGVLGWDSDVDFCVEEGGMAELGSWWNMTVHGFEAGELGVFGGEEEGGMGGRGRGMGGSSSSGGGGGAGGAGTGRAAGREPTSTSTSADTTPWGDSPISRPSSLPDKVWTHTLSAGKKYLLEINPHYTSPSTLDRLNKIDARWIDIDTGLFIDITTVHPVPVAPQRASLFSLFRSPFKSASPSPSSTSTTAQDPPLEMYTKDTHLYTTSSLFPLRSTLFEGTRVSVPYAYEQLLVEEYGGRALTESWFQGWRFQKGTGEWVEEAPGSGKPGLPLGGWDEEEEGDGDGDGDAAAAARREKANSGGRTYVPVPGRKGDVHVVPGTAAWRKV